MPQQKAWEICLAFLTPAKILVSSMQQRQTQTEEDAQANCLKRL